MGIRKRSHHSSLLSAMYIPKVTDLISKNVLSLYHRIFRVDTPTRDLCSTLLAYSLLDNSPMYGTLCDRVRSLGYSRVAAAFNKPRFYLPISQDGVVETLRFHICHENFLKPYSDEFVLTQLLTRAF